MTEQGQPDPPYGPDPDIAPFKLANRIQVLETESKTYATRDWVWLRVVVAMLSGVALLASIIGIITRMSF